MTSPHASNFLSRVSALHSYRQITETAVLTARQAMSVDRATQYFGWTEDGRELTDLNSPRYVFRAQMIAICLAQSGWARGREIIVQMYEQLGASEVLTRYRRTMSLGDTPEEKLKFYEHLDDELKSMHGLAQRLRPVQKSEVVRPRGIAAAPVREMFEEALPEVLLALIR